MSSNEREIAFVEAFVRGQLRRRYLELLSMPRGRTKFLGYLQGQIAQGFDPALSRKCAASATTESLSAELGRLGAPASCYLFSMSPEYDGQQLGLREAVALVIGSTSGTVICCKTGKLAYYESEEPGERYICHRAQ